MIVVTENEMRRLTSVDAIRTVAIACVLTCHYYPVGFFWGTNLGIIGVPMFFVCSGYLITYTTAKRENLFTLNTQQFYVRRFARILPLLVVTIALAGYLTLTLPMSKAFVKVFYLHSPLIFAFTPLLNNWWEIWVNNQQGNPGIQGLFWGVLWSLACEFQFYLGFPYLLQWTGNEQRLRPTLITIALLGLVSNCLAFKVNLPFWWANSFSTWGMIAIGVLVARLKPADTLQALLLSVVNSAILILSYGFADYTVPIHAALMPTAIALASGMLLYGLLSLKAEFPVWFCLPGRLCYGLYLWHPFALFFTWQYGAGWYGIVSMLLAGASFVLIEKPANQTIRRYSDRPEPPL